MASSGKICPDCNQWLSYHFYHKDKSHPDGHKTSCKSCRNAKYWGKGGGGIQRQKKLEASYLDGDTKIDLCHCGNYYKNERFYGSTLNSHYELYEECSTCRESNPTPRIAIEYTMQGPGEHRKELKKESNEKENTTSANMSKSAKTSIEETNTKQVKLIGKVNLIDAKSTKKKIGKELTSKNENTEGQEEMNTTQDKEDTTQKTESTLLPISTQQEEGETQQPGLQNLSNNLRQVNSTSIELLRDSSRLMIESAKSSIKDKVDFDGETIKSFSATDLDNAIRCLDVANRLMQTKLMYIKTGKDLINDLYEVLESDDE